MASALGGTIVARASGAGHSARAIVRLSGPEAFTALGALSDDAVAPSSRGVYAVRMNLGVYGTSCVCPALALVMPGPRSFTGEDCVELLFPGNPWLVDAVIERLLAVPGVTAAAPGAFMARAHATGRIALADAERVALEIGATHASELEAARHVSDNPLVRAAHGASSEIADLLARVEAGIDFTDSEDVVVVAREHLRGRLESIAGEIERWIAGSVPIESMRPLPLVALRGAPNAGKSSLFNALLGRRRTVASPVAGTTRDVIAEEIELPAVPTGGGQSSIHAVLVDTPGVEELRSAIDALMQEQARIADRADVIVRCEPLAAIVSAALHGIQEGSTGADGGDQHGHATDAHTTHVIHVATRSDEVPLEVRRVPNGMVCTSAVTGEGVESLASEIATAITLGETGTGASHRVAVVARHRQAMVLAGEWLARSVEASGDGSGPAIDRPELVADALRGALDALGEVTGEVTPDDVLGLVFSRFCIGK